jgi:DNA-directed RNA polymerase specialized sigma24 family protein
VDLQEICATSAGRLVAQMYGVTGDFAEAQDVVHEAFARALAHPGRMRHVDNPEAWLRRVALNVARSRHRRRVVFDRLAAAAGCTTRGTRRRSRRTTSPW